MCIWKSRNICKEKPDTLEIKSQNKGINYFQSYGSQTNGAWTFSSGPKHLFWGRGLSFGEK